MDSVNAWLDTFYLNAPFVASFVAGILSFLSPCILPLIPPYMSYISGVHIEVIRSNPHTLRLRIFTTSLLFIAGFSVVFVSFGIFANSLLSAFFSLPFVRYVAGVIIIAFGLHFILHFRFSFLYKHINFTFNHARFGLFAPFVLGVGFALGWSPCVGPILGSILSLAIANPTNALYLMLYYCAGLGLAFLLTGIFVSKILFFLQKLKPFMRVIEVISGILLIIIALLIMTKRVDFLV